MEEKIQAQSPENSDEKARETEARKKLAQPPKDKTEVIIAPTNPSGPDVSLE